MSTRIDIPCRLGGMGPDILRFPDSSRREQRLFLRLVVMVAHDSGNTVGDGIVRVLRKQAKVDISSMYNDDCVQRDLAFEIASLSISLSGGVHSRVLLTIHRSDGPACKMFGSWRESDISVWGCRRFAGWGESCLHKGHWIISVRESAMGAAACSAACTLVLNNPGSHVESAREVACSCMSMGMGMDMGIVGSMHITSRRLAVSSLLPTKTLLCEIRC